MDIPADTTTSETGLGQFEVNLMHCDDALRAADDAWLFKMLVKGLARRHGFAASFMAKPYAWNIPARACTRISRCWMPRATTSSTAADPKGTAQLRHAVAGCLRRCTIRRCCSRRISTATTAWCPTSTRPPRSAGAMRTAPRPSAFRPATQAARRIEHRVAGGDVNPYLMLAAILGAALTGLEDGWSHRRRHRQRLCDGPAADSRHLGSRDRRVRTFDILYRFLPKELIRNLVQTKRQELHYIAELRPKNGWSCISTPSDRNRSPLLTTGEGGRTAPLARPLTAPTSSHPP
jgi:glutamine synthetase